MEKSVYLCTRKKLVEHLTLNQGVQGSSPCGCTEEASDPPFFLKFLMHP